MKGGGLLLLAILTLGLFACVGTMSAPYITRGFAPDYVPIDAGACAAGLAGSSAEVPATVVEACAEIARQNAESAQSLRAQIAADLEQAARARALSQSLTMAIPIVVLGGAIGMTMLMVMGFGVYGSNWMRTRSLQVRPTADGQMPMLLTSQPTLRMGEDGRWHVVRHDTVHDPNRALADTTTITTPMLAPSLRDGIAQIAAPVTDAARQARVVTGHQAVQMMSAAHREGITGRESRRVKDLAADKLAATAEDLPIEGETREPRRFYTADASGETKQLAGEATTTTPPALPVAKPVLIG
jgi:hypothetical protein